MPSIASILLAGVEFAPHARISGWSVSRGIGGQVGTLDLLMVSPENPFSEEFAEEFGPEPLRLICGKEIIVTLSNGKRLFGGYLTKVRNEPHGADRVLHKLTCSDYNILLAQSIYPVQFTTAPDKYVIQTVFTASNSKIDTSEVAFCADLPPLKFTGTLGGVLTEASKYTTALFYVDAYRKLQYYLEGAKTAPFALDEDADTVVPGANGGLWGGGEFGEPIFGGDSDDEQQQPSSWLRAGTSYEVEHANPANVITVRGEWVEDTIANHIVAAPAGAANTEGEAGWRKSFSWPPVNGTPGDGGYHERDQQVAAARQTRYTEGEFTYYDASVIGLRFDTGSLGIPDDATIESATLKLSGAGFINNDFLYGNSATIGVEYIPDYLALFDTLYTDQQSNSAYGFEYPVFTGAVMSLPLRNPADNLNRSGITAFRIHLKLQSAPVEVNEFRVYMQEAEGSGFAPPTLEISYTTVTVGNRIEVTLRDEVSITSLQSGTDDGERFRFIYEPRIKTEEVALKRAEYERYLFGEPKTSGSLGILKDGLDIGQVVPIKCPRLYFDETHLINRVSFSYFGASDDQILTGIDFGFWRPNATQIIRNLELSLRNLGAL